MRNNIRITLLMLLLASSLIASNDPVTRTETVDPVRKSLTTFAPRAKSILDAYAADIQTKADSVKVDTGAARKWILEEGVRLGWPGKRIAPEVVKLIKEIETELNKQKSAAIKRCVKEFKDTINKELKEFDPKVETQADVTWTEGERGEAKWTEASMIPVDIKKIEASGSFTVKFKVGIVVGVSAGVDASITFTRKGSVALTIFKPTRFFGGSKGEKVTVKGKPNLDKTEGYSAGGGALLAVTIGIDKTYGDSLAEVTQELVLPPDCE
jgi:hypothetical protein